MSKKQYPEWQEKYRQAQRANNKDKAGRESRRNQADWERYTKMMDEAGIDLYPQEMPDKFTWEYEGYTFQCLEDYSPYSSTRWYKLKISKTIGLATTYSVSKDLKSINLGSIADAIDTIENLIENPPIEEPQLTLEDQLAEIIREMVYQAVQEFQS